MLATRSDCSLADDQRVGDGGVRPSLRHEGEDLSLAGRQHGQRVRAARRAEELRHHFRIQGRPSYGDALERLDEVADVRHTVLQQVPDTGGVVGEQVGRVAGLDVLGEEQDAEPLVTGRGARARDEGPRR